MPRSSKKRWDSMRSSRHCSSSNGEDEGPSHALKKQKKGRLLVRETSQQETDTASVSIVARPTTIKVEPVYSTVVAQEEKEEEESSKINLTDDHKTILAVLASVKSTPRANVAETAFRLLNQLVHSNTQENLMKHIIDADGISLVASNMKKNPDEEGLQVEGRALLGLFLKAVSEKAETKGIKILLILMETFPADVVLQTMCCDILCKVAYEGFYDVIGEAGGIPLIISTLRKHQNEETLLFHGLYALVELTWSDLNCNRVAEAGGIAVVMDILKLCVDNATLDNGIAVLRNLAWQKDQIKPIIEAGGHVEVVSCMKNHLRDEKIQDNGCWALAHLLCSDLEEVWKTVADSGAICAVVGAMKHHPNVTRVQHGACSVLELLSKKGGNEIQTAMIEAGSLEALSTAIRIYRANEDIVSSAKEAWDGLANSLKF